MSDDATRSTALSADEAESILRHAGDGTLDLEDPQIRRVVAEAQRTLAREALWGDTPPQRRRAIVFAGAAFLVLWVCGLIAPLAMSVATR